MNTHTGQIESEFHSYVQPQEHPFLSSFCTELTGITQEQVEAGLPLQICLSRFTHWVQTLQQERGVVFLRDHTQTHTAVSGKHCAFLTWSDWDLGVCLQYECKRKQISKPEVLNSWIDLRATYRMFYHRKPKGLNGALQDLGIEFSGREHSGLDDARNTARLAWRMIRDGCMMKITKSVSRAPLKSGAPVRGVCADGRVCNERKEKRPTHTGDTHTGLHTVTSSRTSVCQSLSAVSSVCINQSGLSLLSANQSAFSTSSSKRLPLPPLRGGVKITSPLCDCGWASRRLTVCNGGPNHGRAFYTCAGRRSSGPAPRYSTHTGSASRNNGCGFFKWESALIKSSAVSGNTSALSFNLRTAASRNFR
ncbi:hypothetical protein PHYPO_G00156540 [Pangasianodon hypophthalmus]|uniref:GRF-type domain-containing protein n=1 Tax=Pangasianodon hypophthalmus TaxID=310915 RepID=A0A5N5K9E0_PANHP|nr:hypothetical protein PHYPO_G00156540 [Pangasianodon hypophthalmus]